MTHRLDWDAYDRVILRSVWDYTFRVDEFPRLVPARWR